jgi:hypothetical protein
VNDGTDVDLLATSNICGQTILRIVSRGNAILTELLRLSQNIPAVFRLETKELAAKYEHIVFDFAYFRQAEAREKTIENSERLLEQVRLMNGRSSIVRMIPNHSLTHTHKTLNRITLFVTITCRSSSASISCSSRSTCI